MPNVRNPITDILPQTGKSPYGISGGSIPGLGDTVTPQQQQVQSCGIGGIIGGAVGAIGFIFGPVGIATTGGGFLLGCTISATLFPQQGSQVFQQAANSLGPLGDFLKAVVLVLSYIGPIISFTADAINYELQLLASAPQLGIFLFPLQAMTTMWIFYDMAEYFRGTGLL